MGYALIAVAFIAFVVVAVIVSRKAGAAKARVDRVLGELDVVRKDKANFHGQLSGPERQPKAVGALALTPDELVFVQLVPEREVRVPRPAITGVEVTRSFRDQTYPHDLVVVRWGDDDAADAVAFDVPEAAAWATELGS